MTTPWPNEQTMAADVVTWLQSQGWTVHQEVSLGYGTALDILAVRGPSLSPGRSEFVNFGREFGPGFEAFYHPETRTVDLWAMTRSQLMAAGVPARNIFGLDLCTRDNPDLFFSFRRERVTGRQAALIWIRG